jgi:HEPN domain-containing protein
MSEGNIDIKRVISYWVDSSGKDYRTMENLIESGDYNWAMFLGHLVIEKLLKAIYVKVHRKHAVYGHDLLRITSSLDLDVDPIKEEWLDTLTTFNLNARYDNYKQDFYKLCTQEFALEWKSKIEQLRQWLMNQL